MEMNRAAAGAIKHAVELGEIKEEMFNALQSNSGIKGIINVAYEYLENPIIVCDTSFSIIECCPEHSNPLDFEIRNNKQYMKPEAVKSMVGEGLVERIFNETKPFIAYRSALGIYMMYLRIAIQKNVAGYVCVLAKGRALTEGDLEIVQALSQMLSVEMQKSSFFTEKAGFKYEYFLTDLIEGNLNDRDFIEQRIIQLGRRVHTYYWIMAVSFLKKQEAHINYHYFIEQLVTILSNSMAFFYKGNLILLLSSDNRKPYDEGEAVKLCEFLALNQMTLAVSNAFTCPEEAPLYYAQTEALLRFSISVKSSESILLYEDYCFECFVEQKCRLPERRTMIHPDLKFLMRYDESHHTEYFPTLKAWLENNRNGECSAQALHIHKSTFFYRLGKICALLGLDMNDCKKLFCYEASIKVIKMDNRKDFS